MSEDTKFPVGTSGNPLGRPKGSRNKVTLLKLMAEEAVRSRNESRMLEVADLIIERALEGDFRCSKLVWEAIMSKGAADATTTAKEKLEIKVNFGQDKAPEKDVSSVFDAEEAEDAILAEPTSEDEENES